MTYPNTFEGLNFRIMEQLEKARGVPLTGREIAVRLHEGEYRTELLDTVTHRVVRNCHALKDKGKIILSDARGADGALTYQLPTRMLFPAKVGTTPANPVLKPEIAAAITPTVPKAKPERPLRPYIALQETLIKLLNKSDRPLLAREIVPLVAHLYPANVVVGNRVDATLSQARIAGKISRRKSTTDGKYEYFTKRTGKGSRDAPVAPTEYKVAIATPKPIESVIVPAQVEYKAAPFKPVKPVDNNDSVLLVMPREKWLQVQYTAKRFGVNIDEFCVQAIDYALSNMV